MAGVAPARSKQYFPNSTGAPLSGGKIDVYFAGTTSRANTWQDRSLTALNTNPIVLNARGECSIWLNAATTYKFVVKDASDAVIYTEDNVSGNGSGTLGWLSVMDFGAVADGSTHPLSQQYSTLTAAQADYPFATSLTMEIDAAAIQAALNYAKTNGLVSGSSTGTQPIYFPKGTYVCGTWTFELHATYHLIGCGRGISPGQGTELKWSPNTSGIIVQQNDTTGFDGVGSNLGFGDGTIIDGFWFRGGWATTPTEGEYHAVQFRAPAIVRNCLAIDWQGDGFYIAAASGAAAGASPPRGNANMWKVEKCRSFNTRDSLHIFGSDANAGTCYDFQATSARRHGINDESFLGNTFYSPMCQEICRTAYNDGVTYPASVVSYGGFRYYVRPGQAVGASTNAPSGAATDNTWWGHFGTGGVSVASGCPAWTSGINVREGFVYRNSNVNNTSVWIMPYREGDETKAYFASAGTVVLEGQGFSADSTSAHSRLRGQGGLSCEGSFFARNNAGTNNGWNVKLGTGNNDTFVEILRFPDGIGSGSAFSMRHSSGDVVFDLANGGENGPFVASGLATAQQFGTGAAYPRAFYPRNLMLGPNMTAARRLSLEQVVPSSGARGQGEIALNKLPTTQGTMGWWCTAAGTPGTWKAIPVTQGYSITAVASSTNSALTHAQCHLRFTNAGATTYTVQPESSVNFESGTTITLERTTAGAVNIAAGAGVTINSRAGSLAISAQWGVATLRKVAADVWTLYGDI